MFCEIYLHSAAQITTDPRFIYLLYFQVLFNQSSIPDFSILNPDFSVNLEVLLIKIILFFFSNTEAFKNNQHFQAIKFLDQPVAEKLDMGFLFYGHEVLQVEGMDSQVQRWSYKHLCDIYVTLGWISTDVILALHVNARKF